MPDWQAHVRERLRLPDLAPDREARIVRELAVQLEDCYRDARDRGAPESEAEAFARAQIEDWPRMAADVMRADRTHRLVPEERYGAAIEETSRGWSTAARLIFAHTVRDGRYAIRQLNKAAGFTTVAALTLALGIGATTAIFSVINGVLLRPLPYPEPDALVRVHEVVPEYGRSAVAPATFLDWRNRSTTLERVAAYTSTSATFIDNQGPERIQGALVSSDLFELLRVPPALGTGFTAGNDVPGAAPVVVISHGLWQRRFNGDPGIVGRAITVDGTPATVMGVMPGTFYFPARTAEFWRPIALDPATASRGAHYLGVVARLKPESSLQQAGAEMKAITEALAAQYPDASANETAEAVALHEQIVGAIRPALLILLAAVGVVVAITCANVANLLLVRSSVREKEIAIRVALGAGRRRLAVQMVVESVVLALSGGGLGLLLAYVSIPWIQSLGAGSIPRAMEIGMDATVLAFAAAASIGTGLVFGLAPAWHASHAGMSAALKEGGRSSAISGARWVRSGLLIIEVALSIVLLVGATLFIRSFARLTNVDPGFRAENVLAFQVSLPNTSYPTDGARMAFFDRLLETLDARPRVRQSAMIQRLPTVGGYVLSFAIRGRRQARPGDEPSANHRVVSSGYFTTLGIPLRRGRLLTPQDSDRSKMVVVVDEAFVRRYFPDEDPIGRGLDIGNGTDGFYEIVGVVGDVHNSGLDATPAPTMYVPYRQDVFSAMWVVTRTETDPALLTSTVRRVVRDIDPALPAYSIQPLERFLADSVADRRFSMLLLTLFAGIAVVLAAVGLYGVVAYAVSQRTREIGLRMAIGAQPRDIVRLVVGGGMKLAIAGVAIGLLAAASLAGLVESMLFEVAPSDMTSYAFTTALLLAVAALACYVPARRAMRIDPIVALQGEP